MVPGGKAPPSPPSSPSPAVSINSCKKPSGFWLMRAANCGLPWAIFWMIGSSNWGLFWTSWRSCWNWGLFLSGSKAPPGRTLPAGAAPWVPACVVTGGEVAAGRPTPPPPRCAAACWAAASKRLTGALEGGGAVAGCWGTGGWAAACGGAGEGVAGGCAVWRCADSAWRWVGIPYCYCWYK